MESRTALLLGATGLIGGHCLQLLLDDAAYDRVGTITRRVLRVSHPKLVQHALDFERLAEHAELFRAHDVYCCLGTTIKQAGSQAAFRRVDFDYVRQSAALAEKHGARQFLLVSSLGANAKSAVFYNRVKGEVEAAVSALPFSGVQIFRPSLLLGERQQVRAGEQLAERLMKWVSFLLVGGLSKYQPIEARQVAAAMLQAAKLNRSGINLYESDRIRQLASVATASHVS